MNKEELEKQKRVNEYSLKVNREIAELIESSDVHYNELLDLLDEHNCTLDVEGQSCICVSIAEDLDKLGYVVPTKKHVYLDEIPF